MSSEDTGHKDTLLEIARKIADSSGGRIRLAYQEGSEDTGHFLKFDERRFGRDIELYAMLGEIQGWPATLVEFLMEVVQPLKERVPDSYAAVKTELLDLGLEILPENLHEKWRRCF